MTCGRCGQLAYHHTDPLGQVWWQCVNPSCANMWADYTGATMQDDTSKDPFTQQQDDVMVLKGWPRSKQWEAYKLLHNLGIRRDMCEDYLIKRQFKKEQEVK